MPVAGAKTGEAPAAMAVEGRSLEQSGRLELSIVVPTYNERENVAALVARLRGVLSGICWEAVFVDDDSPDGTAEEIRRLAVADRSIRLVHRVGRRGLASACVEGMLATSAPYIAVMDADLQHDECILPRMLQQLRGSNLDLVVASRNTVGGSKGEFSARRTRLSDWGATLSASVCKTRLSDPMSGFFMLTRACFAEVARRLTSVGFKILVDIVASAPRPLAIGEVPYTFRSRQHGSSKLDLSIALEYLYLLVDKLSRGLIPARFAVFLMVGGSGIIVHLATLTVLYRVLSTGFIVGQAWATLLAMTWNFFLNNAITFRDARLHGWKMLRGWVLFCLACSLGGVTNLTVAQYAFQHSWPWVLAAVCGITVSSVWNYAVTSVLSWNRK